MFELFALALLQFATITGQPSDFTGSSGWGHDIVGGTTTTDSVTGSSGWGHDIVGGTPTTPAGVTGSSGWGHD
ncbi:hypothetical protein GO988_10845 [Hymenobacter sp. HMF4947]|uniref:Uncharacterized protein n=1 Tax=Hymenobacter ginkgonis TaxID=2682976 RepID=A0A7K1TEI8_9BACT|nr:hypothetical protein [Hymenobacter ginkgonis]MVN76820.1 hypothetical protein [Hymenobacter ginkgonis]